MTQGYQGQVGALAPYQAYLGGATTIESLGQAPLDIGAALGGRMVNTAGANALLQGGLAAAGQNQYAANAYNPFASALISGSNNPALQRGMTSMFQPYMAGRQASAQYGAENVYGPGGSGVVPTSINWDV
jgi:surface antigen